jgi:hypothetical protein
MYEEYSSHNMEARNRIQKPYSFTSSTMHHARQKQVADIVNSTSIGFDFRAKEHATLPSNTISRSFSPPMNVQTLQQPTDSESINLTIVPANNPSI